jgi:hypothetical protein
MNQEISLLTNEKIDSFLTKLRTKSYFLKTLRGYSDSRSSREATTIVKSGLFTENEILDLLINENETIEILREFDKAEKQTFVSALFELKYAFRRFNERNKIKTGKTIFADILNDVFSACESKFEISWAKERDRVESIFASFLVFANEEGSDLTNNTQFRNSFERFYFSRISKKNSIRSASQAEREKFYQELSFFRNAYDKGLNNVIDENKADYLSFLTANLNNAIAKHLPEGTNKISDITISSSAKGYAIEMDLYISEIHIGRLSTRSIPVDGYQVRFHYRYITHVDKFAIAKN